MKEHNHINYDKERINGVPCSQVAEWLRCRLQKRGIHRVTNCPWHADSHPSLVLNESGQKNYVHCFACGKGGDNISFVQQHQGVSFLDACRMISDQFGIPYGDAPRRYRMPFVKPKPRPVPKVEPTFIPMEYVQQQLDVENSLSQCLMQLFDPHLVEYVSEQYMLGRYDNHNMTDGTIFWSIDRNDNVRNGKVQCYCTDIGSERFAHYDKANGRMFWIGQQLIRQGIVPQDAKFDIGCLFGEHLLNRYPSQTVALVESPKNAIVGACQEPQMIWVATGNKAAMTKDVLSVLRGRRVMVIPDRDAIAEWTAVVDSVSYLANFVVTDICDRIAPEGQTKYDIADYIISQRLQ